MRPDTGSYNRLLTSLGLLCLTAAFLVPYFYFKNTSVLLTSRAELNGLTSTARESLLGRQSAISSLEPWVVALSALLALVGLGLVVVGARRLRNAQISEDEETDLRKKRALAEYRSMTPDEQEEKRSKEVRLEQDEERREAVTLGVRDQLPSRPIDADAWQRVQMRFEEIFNKASLDGMVFAPNLAVRSGVGSVATDGLFSSDDPSRPEVVLELKLSSDPEILRKNALNRANEALAIAARLGSVAIERVTVWLVIVAITSEDSAELRNELDEIEERLNQFLLNRGAATVVSETEMGTLPARFRELLREGRFDASFV